MSAAGIWQPIETAPKDGTWVLVWGETKIGMAASRARFVQDHKLGSHWQIAQIESPHCGTIHCVHTSKPTHWMPLPEPPEGA